MSKQYQIDRLLGKGGQGYVYLCKHPKISQQLAMKRIVCADVHQANAALNEMLSIRSLKHEHLVEYYDLFLDQNEMSDLVCVCIVMPYYSVGDLDQFLQREYFDKKKPVELEVCCIV